MKMAEVPSANTGNFKWHSSLSNYDGNGILYSVSKDKSGWNKYRRGPIKRNLGNVGTDTSTLHIESLSNSGDGVGRLDGQVVFVPYTLPGEKVSIRQVSKKRKLIHAQVVKIFEPSERRQQPPCELFGECGGCDWQHVPYELQLEAKTQHLKDALQRIGKFDKVPLEDIVGSPLTFNYRNRIRGQIKSGQFHFHRRSSEQLVPVKHCHLADNAINEFLAQLDADQVQGQVELAVNDRGTVTALPVSEQHSTDAGFRQVNTAISQLLSKKIVDNADRYGGKELIDLYCGQGSWSIEMAQRFKRCKVLGIDSSEQNIHLARQHAQREKLFNVRFEHGRVEQRLRSTLLANSFCIVDPPRAGLAPEVSKALCNNNPTTLVYISCHAASLARDLALLCDSGMHLQSVTPLDMFPQTAHLETLAILHKG